MNPIEQQQHEAELRDRFAMAALTGLTSAYHGSAESAASIVDIAEKLGVLEDFAIAKMAYNYADAMLKAREK